MAESIAQIAQVCGSLAEAIELAGTVPGALLVDIITAGADDKAPTPEVKKQEYIKANFDKLMATV